MPPPPPPPPLPPPPPPPAGARQLSRSCSITLHTKLRQIRRRCDSSSVSQAGVCERRCDAHGGRRPLALLRRPQPVCQTTKRVTRKCVRSPPPQTSDVDVTHKASVWVSGDPAPPPSATVFYGLTLDLGGRQARRPVSFGRLFIIQSGHGRMTFEDNSAS